MESSYLTILNRIDSRRAKISVIGQGYIGLPTALLLSSAGYRVVGYDLNLGLIDGLREGRHHLVDREPGVGELLRGELSSGRYAPTHDPSDMDGSDVFIVAVPTPRIDGGEANLAYVYSAVREASARMTAGTLLIVESTIPPLTSEMEIVPFVQSETGMELGEDWFYSFCPERAFPGRLLYEMRENDRIIGSLDERSAHLVERLYGSFVRGELHRTHVRVAEVSKLVENAYRDVNIAFANEVALACAALNVDVESVISLANRHPRVRILRPGIGVGGSCLTKDPLFLARAAGREGVNLELTTTARKVNEAMPRICAEQVLKIMEEEGVDPEGAKVAILGVTYKGNVPDIRETPVRDLALSLSEAGARVVVYDPMSTESFGLPRAGSLEEALSGADVIILGADHDEFKRIEPERLKRMVGGKSRVILFDGKNALDREGFERAGFLYAGVGRPKRQRVTSRAGAVLPLALTGDLRT